MKKFAPLALAFALTLLCSGLALAMDMNHGDMNHGEMKADGMTAHESMEAMEMNLKMMQKDVDAMRDPAARAEAMKSMDRHMTDMHHGMAGMEGHAEKSGNADMAASMKRLNKEMMGTMKGMGLMRKDADKGLSMMRGGLDKMEKTVMKMKGMM